MSNGYYSPSNRRIIMCARVISISSNLSTSIIITQQTENNFKNFSDLTEFDLSENECLDVCMYVINLGRNECACYPTLTVKSPKNPNFPYSSFTKSACHSYIRNQNRKQNSRTILSPHHIASNHLQSKRAYYLKQSEERAIEIRRPPPSSQVARSSIIVRYKRASR